jgi:hypothetical protein
MILYMLTVIFTKNQKMKLLADGNTLVAEGDQLVLSRPWDESKNYLIESEGAKREGDLIVKRFPQSRFIADPKEIANREKIFHDGVDFVSGMSGYSSLNEKRCAELGIRLGEYEAAVTGIMESAINRVREKMPNVRYGLVYGSSSMGVDLAIENIAKKRNMPLLGYICLDYLWYVSATPDGPYICVKETKKDYCESYVGASDLLMACNGGQVSYQMDTIAALTHFIPVMPINIIGMLGASIPAFKADGTVNDAVGVLIHAMRLIQFGSTGQGLAEDRYAIIADAFANAVTARAREVVPTAHAFDPLKK